MIPIAVAHGDGIGPEIMEAVLFILKEAGAPLDYRVIEIGEKVYLRGCLAGIEPSAWETIRNTKAFLKAPITTPQGGGYKSLNVTVRTTLGLYANIRPCVSYAPFIATKHPQMDVVIVRENEEDLYTGIEYGQTPQVRQSIKLISRPGTEKIVRYAFEFARHHRRKKVTCFTKDNIQKLSDGLFHAVFREVAQSYPDIEQEHWIVDIGAAKLADTPEMFDVIVLPNLYGDILSDVAAQISGSVGIAGSANIGDFGAMFEAIHGSAPRRAGQGVANPSGLLFGAIMMLVHLGQGEIAARIHNAWLYSIEQGIHTYDIFTEGVSRMKVGTQDFARAIAHALGKKPTTLKEVSYATQSRLETLPISLNPFSPSRVLVGVDVFVYAEETADHFQKKMCSISPSSFSLNMITNRGVRIWPSGFPETFCVDQWRCRFLPRPGSQVTQLLIVELLKELSEKGIDIIKTEHLYTMDGVPMYSSAQG